MPKEGEIDLTYPNKLQDIGIELLEEFRGSKTHHKMRCVTCHHTWVATPLAKLQSHRKYGSNGCPICNLNKKESQYKLIRQQHIKQLNERGIIILDSTYDGRLRLDFSKTLKEEKILVKNTHCGHEFLVTPINLIQSRVECGICGPIKRIAAATNWSKQNSKEWQETATEWQQYKHQVYMATRKNYFHHKHTINPNNLLRNKAGVEGAHHLDHIVPIRYCFEHNIPVEICAHQDNLQLIGWKENVGSRDNLKTNVPVPRILEEYIKMI